MGNELTGSGNKVIGVAGGGGAGVFLIHLIGLLDISQDLKNIFIACIPFVSVFLSELFTFITALISLDPQKLRFKLWLKLKKRKLRSGMKDKSICKELRDKAKDRYNICVGIEMGIYKIEDYWKISADAPEKKETKQTP
ncbi:hypothetical protein ACOMXT_001789 [Providencia rettgeri]